ncbi:hypothetical protein GW796_06305 [archaeon]|nr:hypothetical protein [archaeon]
MRTTEFTESQIKQIIEKSLQTANVNNGVIPIVNIDAAASFAAYIAGFSSWKQYRREKRRESVKYDYKVEITERIDNNLSMVDISAKGIDSIKYLLTSQEKIGLKKELVENKKTIFKINVGKSYNAVTKATDTHYLKLENTCFIGSHYHFLDIAKESLIEQNQCIIEITSNLKGEGKLDPINEIFNSEHLEDFLGNMSQDHKDFIFIWGLLIKQIGQQYKIKYTVDFLLKSLNLDFIIQFCGLLLKENNFLANMILGYIRSIFDINMNLEKINISKEVNNLHWENIKEMYAKLTSFKDCYVAGIFSYNGCKVLDSMMQKNSINVGIPDKLSGFIYDSLGFLLMSAMVSYEKQVFGLNIKEYTVFIINKNENIRPKILLNNYVCSFNYIHEFRSKELSHYQQVVLSNHKSFIEPELKFIRDFYLNTKEITYNVFENLGRELLNLKPTEGFLWSRNSVDIKVNHFTISKIKL